MGISELNFLAIWYLTLSDLKSICKIFKISHGTKRFMVENIISFHVHGKEVEKQKIPEVSRGKKTNTAPEPNDLMLYGRYKNDRPTLAFFKKLVGSHFHYTAYGIDYLNECWYAGNPPTYAEFAEWWSQESKKEREPKQEWQYIKFCKTLDPGLSRAEQNAAWKAVYEENKKRVKDALKLDWDKSE